MDVASIYTREWFEKDFAGLGTEFALAATGIHRMCLTMHLEEALDLGAGSGQLLQGLRALGWKVLGYEGSIHGIEYAREYAPSVPMKLYDISSGSLPDHDAELVVCTEVAEHLPEEHAASLVSQIANSARRLVVFTAAPPGQDGHHHVNCQPREYWLELFAEHAMIEDVELTRELRGRWSALKRLSHMRHNVIVLR